MCWIWGFKMTFTQLFLNALENFFNTIVLLEAKKADCNHDIHTEGNYHLVTLSDNLQTVIPIQSLKDIPEFLQLPHKVM